MEVERAHAPKKKWIVLGMILLIVMIVAINLAVMQSKQKGSAADLQFASVTEKKINNTKLIAGLVVPKKTETIYADPAKGEVKELFVKEGQKIQKGQRLFSYDNPEQSIQEKQLEIDKKTADLRYDQGKKKVDSLKKEIQKAKDAHAGKQVTDPLETQLQDAQLEVKTTELEMEKNTLQADNLQNKQKNLIVYSHMDGIVQTANKDAEQASGQAATGQANPIIQIASTDPYQIEGTLTELQQSQIQPNQPITITAKAISNVTWTGKITEVSEYPASDSFVQSMAAGTGQQTQNISYYHFKALIDSPKGLSPGYHVSIQVKLASQKMLAIPRSSIVESGNSPFVYVVQHNKLRKQKLTTGMGDGEWTEVLEGLKPGDKVVKNPSDKVYDGLEVAAK